MPTAAAARSAAQGSSRPKAAVRRHRSRNERVLRRDVLRHLQRTDLSFIDAGFALMLRPANAAIWRERG
jgi:hypothetical protein